MAVIVKYFFNTVVLFIYCPLHRVILTITNVAVASSDTQATRIPNSITISQQGCCAMRYLAKHPLKISESNITQHYLICFKVKKLLPSIFAQVSDQTCLCSDIVSYHLFQTL